LKTETILLIGGAVVVLLLLSSSSGGLGGLLGGNQLALAQMNNQAWLQGQQINATSSETSAIAGALGNIGSSIFS
jgi:hypothetical protein